MAIGGLILLGVAAFATGILHQMPPTTPATLQPTQQPSLQIAIATPAPEVQVAAAAPAAPRHPAAQIPAQIPPHASEAQQPATVRAEPAADASATGPDAQPPAEAAPQL